MSSKYAFMVAGLPVLGVAACSGIEREPAASMALAAQARSDSRESDPQVARHSSAPFVVHLSGPQSPVARVNTRMTLVGVVDRDFVDATPLRLVWTLPAGVSLAEGRLTEEIVDTASSRIVRQLVIEADSIPESDVLLAVEAMSASWGARGEAAYRFGRPEPLLPQPPRDRGPITVKGAPQGRPVMMPAPAEAR